MPRANTTQSVDHAIELYTDGNLTVAEIVEQTGVPKATLYYNLQQRGLGPQRQTRYAEGRRGPRAGTAPDPSVVHAMERIEQLSARVAKLEALLREYEIEVPD